MGFEHDTAVRRTGDGRFEAQIPDERWWVARGPHGGFVAAIVVNALTEALGDATRPIRSLTIHYPAAPRVGRLDIAVSAERVGRTTAYLSARMEQEGRVQIREGLKEGERVVTRGAIFVDNEWRQ